MAYVHPNFKSKKALKTALENGAEVIVFQPGLGSVPVNGEVALEGPHYPEAHTWYAEGVMKEGKLIKVR